MDSFARPLIDHVRLADGLDIAVVAVLIYILLVWLRDRASRSLAVIVVSLGVLFLIARWLDLFLTIMAFRYGIVGLLLAMVVVFQQDIRHGFERLTSTRWFRGVSDARPSHRTVDTITQTVTDLAKDRIGALLVFPNRQPLDLHLQGGVEVDAQISEPLLKSIFHPKSPGHDGAVLIQGHRIVSLGLHLPLTTRFDQVPDGGTRHAAAAGLAECSDALVVAVSEERGTITLAQDGQLKVIEPAELASRLGKYYHDQNDVDQSNRTRRDPNWGLKLVAIALATLSWWLFAFQTDTVQRTFVVPIEFRNLPEGFQVADPKPTYAELTLSGPENAFTLLDPVEMTVSLDLRGTDRPSVTTWHTANHLTNIPRELTTEAVVPETILISLQPSGEIAP
ncbi:diadenylate cyclase [Neorhodopirellula pilleata]|uniref:Diadenylate cyclase n=1 Tax=Neorhodopirellula pilleata TaxID=2714738 RepID=A0A5C6A2A2_9BACT|nr:diadenylate cyclase [Neorhodopirellula pilleata]TWT93546.1 DNA integrity scanning protein DisA [Neorhodopirellula pilleata]